jgi:hypothetical protein
MRKFKACLITFAASTTILWLGQGVATAAPGVSNSFLSSTCVLICFDIYYDDVVIVHNADLPTVAEYCHPLPIIPLQINQTFVCADGHTTIKRVH